MNDSWSIRNGLLSFPESRPLIMGIVNVTPDSFSDGGLYNVSAEQSLERIRQLAAQGADIIDIGGQSTRPGHVAISDAEEWTRLCPVFELIRKEKESLPPISVDTYYPYVAKKALEYGADIINDVTGFDSSAMRAAAEQSGCGCVIMHHDDITGEADPIQAVRTFFERRTEECAAAGIKPESMVLDVGIGFGKTREQELELIKRCSECSVYGLPILAGASRKRLTVWAMEREGIAEASSLPMTARDQMTHRLHKVAYNAGARIIRVHDAAGARKSFFEKA